MVRHHEGRDARLERSGLSSAGEQFTVSARFLDEPYVLRRETASAMFRSLTAPAAHRTDAVRRRAFAGVGRARRLMSAGGSGAGSSERGPADGFKRGKSGG